MVVKGLTNFRDRDQKLLLVLSEFKQINQLVLLIRVIDLINSLKLT